MWNNSFTLKGTGTCWNPKCPDVLLWSMIRNLWLLGEIVSARNPQLVSHSHLDWAESLLCLILTRCNWITKWPTFTGYLYCWSWTLWTSKTESEDIVAKSVLLYRTLAVNFLLLSAGVSAVTRPWTWSLTMEFIWSLSLCALLLKQPIMCICISTARSTIFIYVNPSVFALFFFLNTQPSSLSFGLILLSVLTSLSKICHLQIIKGKCADAKLREMKTVTKPSLLSLCCT